MSYKKPWVSCVKKKRKIKERKRGKEKRKKKKKREKRKKIIINQTLAAARRRREPEPPSLPLSVQQRSRVCSQNRAVAELPVASEESSKPIRARRASVGAGVSRSRRPKPSRVTLRDPQPIRQPAASRRFDPTQRSRNARLQPSPSEAVGSRTTSSRRATRIRKPTPRCARTRPDRSPAP